MNIKDYYYITEDEDLESLFDIIKEQYESMKKNRNKTETMKFNPEAIGQTNIRMRWKMDFFLFEENKVQLLEDGP